MALKSENLRKYGLPTIEERLEHICVMLEKIVDGLSHPQVYVQGDLLPPQGITKEQCILQEENARLREQLRWHSVDELPPLETANCSKTVLLDVDYIGVFKMYYNYLSELWVGIQGKQEYFRQQDFKNIDARWCYIPDDKDGDK